MDEAPSLPTPLTTLIGREHDVAEVSRYLTSGQARLLTLTGPGGIGKTRLALQVAADLHGSFEGGAFFVPLVSVSNPGLVLSTIARTLGVTEAPGRPLLDSLCLALRDKRLLLILDNFEQVVVASNRVAELLVCAPMLHILVTSRIVLKVYGEYEYPVAPLSLPDAAREQSFQQLTQYEAVRLFIERARAAKPSFSVNNSNAPAVAEICHRLDGLPLAIELAAARVKVLPPQALLTRLDRTLPVLTGGAINLPLRHQTLHNAIAWSYDLLSESEKALFRSLSVFAGGCTLEAAEAIYNAEGRMPELARGQEPAEGSNSNPKSAIQNSQLDALASLVDQSLLRQEEQEDGEARFSMFETIREFAAEKLAESAECGEVEGRHTDYFVQLAERAEIETRGPEQAAWLDRVAREHDNIRATLQRASLSGNAETGLRLGGALWRFWYMRGYLSEGRKWLSEALEDENAASPAARAKAFNGMGNIAEIQCDYSAARTFHEKSLSLWQKLSNKQGIALSLNNLGILARFEENFALASELNKQSLALLRELGHKQLIGLSLHNLSFIMWRLGEYEYGRQLCEESIDLLREIQDKGGMVSALTTLGIFMAFAGDHEAARKCQEECLALWRELGDKVGVARSLYHLGDAVAEQGDYRMAHTFYSDSLRLRAEMGNKRGVAECLQGIASARREQAEPRRLVQLFASADALYSAIGLPLTPQDRERYDKWLPFAREKLGPAEFDKAWDEGKRLSMEEATALALEAPQGAAGAPNRQSTTMPATASKPLTGPGSDLTTREVEVLRLIAVGLTNPDIAAYLHVSINTIQTHLRSIFSKINVKTRGAAVRYAFEHNLG